MYRSLLAFCVLALCPFINAQTDDWKQLFDGKNLTGWKHVGPGYMTVEDGLIRTHGGMGLLYWTGGELGGSPSHVGYKIRDHNKNAGLFIPIPRPPQAEMKAAGFRDHVHTGNNTPRSKEG